MNAKSAMKPFFFWGGGGLTFVFQEVRKGNFYQNSQLILLETSDEN